MQLQLERPLVFFDIEATGLSTSADRIVELSLLKVMPDGKEEQQTFRFNPEMPISAEASAVNGITDEDVADCPIFKEKAEELYAYLTGCDLAGFNSDHFDVPMLVEEFARCGFTINIQNIRTIDVQTIFHKMEPRTLTAAYKYYCQKDLTQAHTAAADTFATYEVLKSQLDKYGENLQNNVDWLSNFTRRSRNVDLAGRIVYNEQGEPTINFGKHKGRSVKDLLTCEPGYFSWMMQGDFTQDTKQTLLRLKLSYGL